MQKTVVVVDMLLFSVIEHGLEAEAGGKASVHLGTQVRSFVNEALQSIGENSPESTIAKSTGDGAILVFESPTQGFDFVGAFHSAVQRHNQACNGRLRDLRIFRSGMATGDLIQNPIDIHGGVVSRAVRLEGKSSAGGLLVDAESYEAMGDDRRWRFDEEEAVPGKHPTELYRSRRIQFDPSAAIIAKRLTECLSSDERANPLNKDKEPVQSDTRLEILALFTQLKTAQYTDLIFRLKIPIEARLQPPATLAQQKARILEWSEEAGNLDLLLRCLRDLLGARAQNPH